MCYLTPIFIFPLEMFDAYLVFSNLIIYGLIWKKWLAWERRRWLYIILLRRRGPNVLKKKGLWRSDWLTLRQKVELKVDGDLKEE